MIEGIIRTTQWYHEEFDRLLRESNKWKRGTEKLASYLAGFRLPGMDGHIMTQQDYISFALEESE